MENLSSEERRILNGFVRNLWVDSDSKGNLKAAKWLPKDFGKLLIPILEKLGFSFSATHYVKIQMSGESVRKLLEDSPDTNELQRHRLEAAKTFKRYQDMLG